MAQAPRIRGFLAGDGDTYDIGFQCLSSAAERNESIIHFGLDNAGYMNTGAQKSSSTPHHARTGKGVARAVRPLRRHGRRTLTMAGGTMYIRAWPSPIG
jgi:pyruvate/2-oxoacid:ferredoxin oxidoreductase beta subunit